MDEEKVRQSYRDEGWGALAEAHGFDPVHTESVAREVFRRWYEATKGIEVALEPMSPNSEIVLVTLRLGAGEVYHFPIAALSSQSQSELNFVKACQRLIADSKESAR